MKSSFVVKVPVIFVLLFGLTGCWGSSDIQNMAYATAIGIDYNKGHYIAYVQVLNFSNVAKVESVEIGKPLASWIGKGIGRTITEALEGVVDTSQLRIFWGHVKTVIVTESVMKNGIDYIYEAFNRYREVRYTVTVYGTDEDIPTLLAQKSLLNFSPLDSLLVNPTQNYQRNAYIQPLMGFQFIAKTNEPGNSTLLPALSLNQSAWKEDAEQRTMFTISGAFVFNSDHYVTRLSLQDLVGLRWMIDKMKGTSVHVPDVPHPAASLILKRQTKKITPLIRSKEIRFRIRLKFLAEIIELRKDKDIKEIGRETEQVIRDEIMETYRKGIAKNCDVYQLSEVLYQQHPKVWKREFSDKSFPLHEDSIDIEVSVDIRSSGKYKMK
ncbi:Ger(x)C family spore germination protein [Paenibacillus oenotherae]|uniref:Ger(X)C family spore germination protein n=1 Tax=Paenibacillus oenotherae TaxID=1435645 RepID=A0ABS7D660_9BACL|nr:Ger(x)C family spore germination protein [Paenibacillus oenotherae]MBW7475365.1 Ger(x)C family spore germination protein [Paenibacillus oenotherae]